MLLAERCFMHAVCYGEAPPPPRVGGGAIADSQNRLGTKWGQAEVTYCRLGLGCSGWVCKGNVCIVHGMCYHTYRVFV
jgi:hypothetical protein